MSSKKKAAAAKKINANQKAASATSSVLSAEKNRFLLPILFALAVIPLTVHMVILRVDPNETLCLGSTLYADLFSQSKAQLILLTGAVLLLLSIFQYKTFFKKRSGILTAYLAAGGVFVLFTLISAAFSQYSSLAFWGSHDRAEGALVLCCYFLLLFYAMYAYKSERDSRNIIIALGIVVTVSSAVGLFQYFGHDLLMTDFGKALAIAPWDRSRVTDMGLLSSSGRLYGTFYHWDYAGSFAAVTVPIFLLLALHAKNLRARLALWGMELLSVWILLGSTSRAGIVGVFFALIFGIIFFGRMIKKHWKISCSAFLLLIAATTGINLFSHGVLFSRIPSLLQDAAGIFQSSSETDSRSQLPIKGISAKDHSIVIVMQNNDTLNATLKDSMLLLKDNSNQTVSVETKNGESRITDPRFQQIAFGMTKMGLSKDSMGIAVSIEGQPQFFFRMDEENHFHMTNASGTIDIDSLETPPTFGFKGKEKLGSARGYIWSRALPMVPQHLLLGAGPDTFELYFPQNDLWGKYLAYGTANMQVDKPHNLYLQILLGEGGIALLAFLTIIILYLVDSFRLYALKKKYYKNQIYGAAFCLGIVGYLFAGLFNDSVVSVAPVFWIILGVGIAVNFQNHKQLPRKDSL
ncbi:MAG: O-antigen ligase family protein [Oscillospiraceae bacterium]|jgi:hypothetical protein|nr:O-antigen ligase family protein [Oscillospiraceae bacterium]